MTTWVCIGGGESLTRADVDSVRGKAKVIAINDAYRLAPWADVLYACDGKWWRWHWQHVKDLAMPKYALDTAAKGLPGVTVLENTGKDGLDLRPGHIREGRNSGYQAINLAVHLGATRILLLGYDMRGGHWFGSHPDGSRPQFDRWLQYFETLVEPLNAIGVEVINCTRVTRLKCFPLMTLEEALAMPVQQVHG